jgi:hypothetical protein
MVTGSRCGHSLAEILPAPDIAVQAPLCIEKTRRNRSVHHFTQGKCGFNPRDPRQTRYFLPVNDFIILDRCSSLRPVIFLTYQKI